MIHPDTDATITALREELARTEERARLHAAEAQRLGVALGAANARAVAAEMALSDLAAHGVDRCTSCPNLATRQTIRGNLTNWCEFCFARETQLAAIARQSPENLRDLPHAVTIRAALANRPNADRAEGA